MATVSTVNDLDELLYLHATDSGEAYVGQVQVIRHEIARKQGRASTSVQDRDRCRRIVSSFAQASREKHKVIQQVLDLAQIDGASGCSR